MKSKSIFLIGLVLLALTGLAIYGFMASSTKQAEQEQAALEETVAVAPKQLSKVVVVKQDIAARSQLTPEMIDIQEVPA